MTAVIHTPQFEIFFVLLESTPACKHLFGRHSCILLSLSEICLQAQF